MLKGATTFPDVFNTEAHPFEAPAAKAQYGSGSLLAPNPGFTPQSVGAPLPAISPNAKAGSFGTNTGN